MAESFPAKLCPAAPVTDLEHHQDAAYDAGVSVDHGLLHDVTDAAEVAGLDGMLFSQQRPQWQAVAAGRQQVELMDTHSTYMMKQLVDHIAGGHRFLCERTNVADGQICDLIQRVSRRAIKANSN